MEQIYRPILKQAWHITKRFNYLWFFGLFAAIFGSAGIYNINFSVERASNGGDWLLAVKDFLVNFQTLDWLKMTGNVSLWVIVLLVVMLGLGLFILWLSVVSQGALIYGAKEANQGRRLFFGEVLARGQKKFWPLLLLNLIMGVAAAAILLVFSLPFLIFTFWPDYVSRVTSLFVAVSFVVLVPVGVVISFIIRYSLIFIVNKDRSLGAAISEAWSMLKRHWLASVEMLVILWLVFKIAGIILNIVLVYLIAPLVAYLFVLFASTYAGAGALADAMMYLMLIIYLLVMFLIAAIFNVFETAIWVLFFEKLNEDEVESKVMRLAQATLGPVQTDNLLAAKTETLLPPVAVKKPAVKRVVRKRKVKTAEEKEE